MPAERFFTNQPILIGEELILSGQERHHLVDVMRPRAGEPIELVNGQGALAQATFVRSDRQTAVLRVESVEVAKASANQYILAQAIPRINRLDFIVEKGTELGMTALWLFPSERSERKVLTEHQVERLDAMAIAAMKQCGRLFLPKIELKPPLMQWKRETLPVSCEAFFGDVDPEAPLFLHALAQQGEQEKQSKQNTRILFFIGPESGFTDKEVEQLKHLGAEGVSLHPNILRTDTAALAALTLATHALQ